MQVAWTRFVQTLLVRVRKGRRENFFASRITMKLKGGVKGAMDELKTRLPSQSSGIDQSAEAGSHYCEESHVPSSPQVTHQPLNPEPGTRNPKPETRNPQP
ncbi:hypothetical protein T484DRAFT_2953884 [Baffinella frigidus]|nr:hypothetical protein T484DRAFT_2953884 [Cryptophyta sp. CCMP2293]